MRTSDILCVKTNTVHSGYTIILIQTHINTYHINYIKTAKHNVNY